MPSPPEFGFADEDRRELLEYARQSVQSAVTGNVSPAPPLSPVFARICGVFVTLHVQGKLRGCIGVIEAQEPLGASISHCAASAALHDPRFSPVRAEELSDLQIEISLLSPPVPILPEEIEIGRHGLLVVKDRHRGLLLPQVAVEHSLDRASFLSETCRKAGLSRDAWKSDPLQVFGFTCEVFSDHTEHSSAA